jgi:iron complex outermembrane receptor protein
MDNKNEAVFGQIDYTPDYFDRLTVSLGGRYTRERKEMTRYLRNFTGNTGTFTVVDPGPNLVLPDLKFSNTSYMISPNYRITDKLNVYAKYAEGFRSGGYDGSSTTPASAAIPFKSEELKTYEAGLKSRWLESHLELNLAVFHSNYTNMQLSSFNGTVAATLNAGKAQMDGVEVESTALITDNLRAGVSLALLDYKFDKFDMGPAIGDVSGRARLNNAPHSTANVSLDYDFPRFDIGALALHLNYNYAEAADAIAIKSTGAAPNSPLSSRGLLDARLTLSEIEVGASKMQVALWGMNLTDTEYYDNVIDFGGYRAGTLGWPRTYGAEVSLQF